MKTLHASKSNQLRTGLALFALAALPFSGSIAAAPGKHRADGNIVIIREVEPRVAYRQEGPGPISAQVNASPRDRVLDGLGVNSASNDSLVSRELSDKEFASITSSVSIANPAGEIGRSAFAIEPGVGSAAGSMGGRAGSAAGAISAGLAGEIGRSIGGIGRTVGGVTSGILSR